MAATTDSITDLLFALRRGKPIEIATAHSNFLGLNPSQIQSLWTTSDRQRLYTNLAVGSVLAFKKFMEDDTSYGRLEGLFKTRDYTHLAQLTVEYQSAVTALEWKATLEANSGLAARILAGYPALSQYSLRSQPPSPAPLQQLKTEPARVNSAVLVANQRYYGFDLDIPDFEGGDELVAKYVAKFYLKYLTMVEWLPIFIKGHFTYRVDDREKVYTFHLSTAENVIYRSLFSFGDIPLIQEWAAKLPSAPGLRGGDMFQRMFRWIFHCGRIEAFRAALDAMETSGTTKFRSGTEWFIRLYSMGSSRFQQEGSIPHRLTPFVEILVDRDPNNARLILVGYNVTDVSEFAEDLVEAGDRRSLELILEYAARYDPKPVIYPSLMAKAAKLGYQDLVVLLESF